MLGLKFKFQTEVELELNLFGIQTCLEKFGKFPKIPICLGILECEFRLVWLYGKNCSFHASSVGLGLKIKDKSI
jgi:hypothetical protein